MAGLASFGNDLYTGRRQFDFIGKRKRWYAISAILMLIALGGLLGRGLNLGLEFTGGSQIQVPGISNTADYDTKAQDAVRSVTGSSANVDITKLGEHSIQVESKKLGNGTSDTTDQVKNALAKKFNVAPSSVTSSFVGPSWGSTVTHKAVIALITFLVFVSLLLALYFRTWTMAAASLVALAHDLLFTIGVYALTGLEVTPATMIGFLTILGYSIYDTVVVFDKVRENSGEAMATGRRSFAQAANYAVNQTLVRSINTSIVALLPIASILVIGSIFIGPSTLLDIAAALFIGIVIGTLSSIFIATPILTDLRRRDRGVQELARRASAYQARSGLSASTGSRGAVASGVVPSDEMPSAETQGAPRANRRPIHPAAMRDDS